MLRLRQKQAAKTTSDATVSMRDKLLLKEVQEMEQTLPKTCRVHFSDPNKLHLFSLIISPSEGYWKGGHFTFTVHVPLTYNIAPPTVKCTTRVWHPNITEAGEVCLSLLRQNSIDSMGWSPTRRLKDVVWGLSELFSDLLNFDDPLNIEAAEQYAKDKTGFIQKATAYVEQYASGKRRK